MANIGKSAIGFVRGTWVAIFAAFAAITDPLALAKMTGFIGPDTQWILGDVTMRYFFVAVAVGWAFLWYHGVLGRTEYRELHPTMPLHLACRWVAKDSIWAANYPPQFDGEWRSEVHDEIMSKLLTGRIEMFGRKRESQHLKGPMQYVTGADKSRVEWDYRKLGEEEPPSHMWCPGTGVVYHTVQLDRQQVRRIWPRKSMWARLRGRSPVERLNLMGVFQRQDAHYRENFGFTPTPMEAILSES